MKPGRIEHTIGWPADSKTYAGSFVYHLDNDRLYVGYIVGLNYEDPRLKPFEAFQQFKNHPHIRPLFEGGEILAAGARTIAAGGWQSIPQLAMPGAVLIGDTAGGVNVTKDAQNNRFVVSFVALQDVDTEKLRQILTTQGAVFEYNPAPRVGKR